MIPFGCPVTILNTLDPLGKFDEKVDDGFFVGYSINSKAFRVFNTRTRKVEENLHINFLENKPNVAGSGPDWLFDIDLLTNSMNYEPITTRNQTNKNSGIKDNVDAVPTQQYILLPLLYDSPQSSKDAVANDADKKTNEEPAHEGERNGYANNTNRDSTVSPSVSTAGQNFTNANDLPTNHLIPDLEDTGIFSVAYDDEDVGAVDDLNNMEITMNLVTSKGREEQITKIIKNCLFAYFLSQIEPKKVIQALTDPSWIEAMQEELLQFKLQKVWTLVDLPKGKRAIGTKWMYRNKKDERGIVVRNKARLVAQGYTQEEGIDYDEAFAPVARIEAIILFLAYTSFMGFIMYQMDVKSAFLYGTIEEEVYVCQNLGFEDPQFPSKVYKVEKALYGLHQAPRAWYKTLSTYLLENRFIRGTIDKTLFIKKDKGDILLVHVYVDDIIFGSTKNSLCVEFEQMMHKKFQISSMGELTFFLGLQVMQKDDGIFINQDMYVADILKKFDFVTVKTASTPIEIKKALLKDEEAKDVDVHLYRSMIRSLMYLTASRPDIMFAVCACARFQVTPKASHLNAVKRIFRYLKGQPKLGLWYPRDSPFDLEAFSDSDYAGASVTGNPQQEVVNFLEKGWFHGNVKKQTIVANSTTVVEYVAAANCYGQNLVFHSKIKHIEIRHHFIRDSYEKKLIQVIKIHTDHNVADLLTKDFDVSRLNLLLPVLVYAARHSLTAVRHKLMLPGITFYCWIQALVDKKKVIISETSIKSDLKLDDAEGTNCLPTATIFAELERMGYNPLMKCQFGCSGGKHPNRNEIKDLDANAEMTLVDETQEMNKDNLMFDTCVLEEKGFEFEKVVEEPVPMMEAYFELAQRIQAEEQGEITIEERSRLFVELMNRRKKHFVKLREGEIRRKPPTKSQKRNQMSTYLKNMAGYKHSQLKSKCYDEIQKLFDKEMKRVNTFVDMNSEVVKGNEHVEVKKEDQEEAEMRRHIEIVKDDEVAIDAIPLATKPLVIVEYKIDKDGMMGYFKLIRANGSSKRSGYLRKG
ncbi:putative ribonuclease H-like domain-containing protein, partial [Tanacetum coccineum]